MHRKTVGPDHPNVAQAMANLALGQDRPQVAALTIERGQVDLDRGEAAAAESLLREALRVQRLTSAEDSWRIASIKSLLGAALMELRRFAEAEPLLIEASRRLKDIPGPQGREAAPTRERLAALQHAKSRSQSD